MRTPCRSCVATNHSRPVMSPVLGQPSMSLSTSGGGGGGWPGPSTANRHSTRRGDRLHMTRKYAYPGGEGRYRTRTSRAPASMKEAYVGTRTLRRIGIPLCRWIAGRARGKSACVWKQTRKRVCADRTFPRQRVGFHNRMVERVLFNKGHREVSVHLDPFRCAPSVCWREGEYREMWQ